jgi:catalase
MTTRLLAAMLVAIPALSQAQTKSVPQRIADDFVILDGGAHPGYRLVHAKGIVLTGTFTPSPGAAALSRAPHFTAASTPVIVRYSDGSGLPNVADNVPGSPRGIAIRFTFPSKAYTDILGQSHNGFAVGTGEEFVAFLDAVLATKPTSPHPSPIEAYLGSHPAARRFATDVEPLPVGFGAEQFYGDDAFIFVNASGARQAVRYHIVPVTGTKYLDSAAAARTPPNYLFDELRKQLAKEPVKLRVLAQLANAGDQTSDGSMPWPDDRNVVELGIVTLTAIAPNNAALQRSLTFNPIFLCDGIQLSDDPLPSLRSAVYALSILHRRP